MLRKTSWWTMLFTAAAASASDMQAQAPKPDWANLARFRAENALLGAPRAGEQRVVFMGNSITEAWAPLFPTMFPNKPYIGRGISGQTTPQMLARFRQDVVALAPAVVVILAGTNDIAGNTGPSSLEMIENNIASMAEIAQAHGIRVVLSSVLPVFDYPWKPRLRPAPKIIALNAWLKHELGDDGVHPNLAGYRIMAPLVESAIREALKRTLPRAP